MKYRKYIFEIKTWAVLIFAVSLVSCASGQRAPDSVPTEEEQVKKEKDYDGREPASLRGDFTWLNEVEDNFSKVAEATSDRAVASTRKKEVLIKKKDWNFGFHEKANQFFASVQGTDFKMVQTRINDGERYAFAAEGQAENPVTFSVMRAEGRGVASGQLCETEISYWNKKSKTYVTEQSQIKGKTCEHLLDLLKDYVP